MAISCLNPSRLKKSYITYFKEVSKSNVVKTSWAVKHYTRFGKSLCQVLYCFCLPCTRWSLWGTRYNTQAQYFRGNITSIFRVEYSVTTTVPQPNIQTKCQPKGRYMNHHSNNPTTVITSLYSWTAFNDIILS